MASKNGPNNTDSSSGATVRTDEAHDGSRWPDANFESDATGEAARLVRELTRISQELDPRVSADWTLRRLMFFAYELQTRVAPDASEKEKLAILNDFFFIEKKFKRIPELNDLGDPSDAYRIGSVLATRRGSATVLAVVYAFLAERVGISLGFVDLKPASFLKWNKLSHGKEKIRACYIDITRFGAILSDEELIETLHTRFQIHSVCHASVLEAYIFETYICDYLRDLKRSLAASHCDPEQLLFVHSALISYQPNNLQLLAERALLHRRIGNFKSALADLKRFFAFHERDQAPAEFVSLYEELVELLERNSPSI